jgi:hypothetical protein
MFLAAFHLLVGSFGVFVGLLTIQAMSLSLGSMFLLWAAYYGLPERLQRTRIALRALFLLAALATMGFALASFRDYRVALLVVLFWGSVMALAIYLIHLKSRRESRRP